MKLVDIVRHVKNEKPDLFGKIAEKKAVALLRESFAHLARLIDEQEDVVKIPNLGNFRTRSVAKKEGGQKIISRRIVFHPAPSAKKESGEETEEPDDK